jgi:hypothetical protein
MQTLLIHELINRRDRCGSINATEMLKDLKLSADAAMGLFTRLTQVG